MKKKNKLREIKNFVLGPLDVYLVQYKSNLMYLNAKRMSFTIKSIILYCFKWQLLV